MRGLTCKGRAKCTCRNQLTGHSDAAANIPNELLQYSLHPCSRRSNLRYRVTVQESLFGPDLVQDRYVRTN